MKLGFLGNTECVVSADAVECLLDMRNEYASDKAFESVKLTSDEINNYYEYMILTMSVMQYKTNNMNIGKYINKNTKPAISNDKAKDLVENALMLSVAKVFESKETFLFTIKTYATFAMWMDKKLIKRGEITPSEFKSLKAAIKAYEKSDDTEEAEAPEEEKDKK